MFVFSLNIYLYVLSRKKDVASLFCFQSKQGFLHHSNRPGPLTNGFKQFRFWSRFRRDIRIFRIYAQYDTARSHVTFP